MKAFSADSLPGITKDSLQGTLLEIQRMSTEDGPGIRTTIFFKGCSLHCTWCHNPESISPRPQIQWIGNRCLGCQTCLSVCPKGALTATPEGMAINRRLCDGCGKCADECPSTAMEILGVSWEVNDLFREIIKDQVYFEKSGGGITLGGGEPVLQSPFATDLLRRLKEQGVATAVDTAGLCPWEALEGLLPYTDLLLYDLKIMDPQKHTELTGAGNSLIQNNLLQVRDRMEKNGRPTELWIRTPIIPEATATETNIEAIGRFIQGQLNGMVRRWDLCAFNNLCRDKYVRLGLDWVFRDTPLLDRLFMERMAEVACSSGVDPQIVRWSGATRMEDQTTL
ncbi:MAG TPA: glycyl-radical enzyme activating protein [Thermodesulfobacteriota bacterium]|nr:glycyl-radical enzyme activating protein [Thermodesulfobacteriota bacterium]